MGRRTAWKKRDRVNYGYGNCRERRGAVNARESERILVRCIKLGRGSQYDREGTFFYATRY